MVSINILGRKFNQLVVLERVSSDKFGHTKWLCACDCGRGNKLTVIGDNLIRGRVKSCRECKNQKVGNAHKGKTRPHMKNIDWSLYTKPKFESVLNARFSKYQNHAKNAERPFELTLEDFQELILGACFYCGIVGGTTVRRGKSKKYEFKVNGVDRLENKLGYTKNNCVSCCTICNRMKYTHGVKSFIKHILNIAEYQNKQKVNALGNLYDEYL